jgi:predicted transposase/invertase (TIGR01784 family)
LTVLEIMNFSEDEKEGYEDHLKWLRIQTNTIKKYEQNAREEGFSEGKAEGKAEGEEKLNKERRDIAKNLLKQGVSIEIVMTSTGLTREEIEAIQKDL